MPPESSLPGPVGAARPRVEIPVARPAPRVEAAPEAGPPAEASALPPSVVKGWATSVALHAVLLLVMAFWYLSTRQPADSKPIDTRLMGGDPLGDPSGIEGGLTFVMGGQESPLALPATEPVVSPLAAPDATVTVPKPREAGLFTRRAHLPDTPRSDDAKAVKNPGKGGGLGGEGFGVARFGSRDGSLVTERVQGVQVRVGDPQFTLIWDTQADLDLHVIEPGGSEIFWVERSGDRGGELDVDNLTGFGPENIYWVAARDEKGRATARGHGPTGDYKWFVHYYGGTKVVGQDVPTHWKVRVKHKGVVTVYQGTLRKRQRSKMYTLAVSYADLVEAEAKNAAGPTKDSKEVEVMAKDEGAEMKDDAAKKDEDGDK